MDKYVTKIKGELHDELYKSALGYLKTGLDLFHAKRTSWYSMQPAIGNLGIAVELMLKTLLVNINPVLLFKDFPIELRLLFVNPKSMPKGFNWRHYDADIKSNKYKAVELDECISVFYIMYPDHKQEMQPYLKILSKTRNASVHLALPSFQAFDFTRTAYLALKMYLLLDKYKALDKYIRYTLTDKDKKFFETYEAERESRVRAKVEKAKEKSRNAETIHVSVNGWDDYVTSCPICHNDAVLQGYTEMDADIDEDGNPEQYLTFFANNFECEACGLNLSDSNELKLAGIDEVYDRSDYLDKWFRDQGEY